ncbi:PH domain-containing protein [Blastococcus xanthinilyticus]|uniref:PH (Pleckstrin Homology) domain-containing protein n=1 Tax=Blastococcus xanthinilyticus TaxID=1564164 RepID=A0A5S5CNM3_9ACTN|nr:PH domain-containing protein [Blastococcus xanthinilyticus]TYP84648.1 PH (Pleckstrin Homology) domain-containing protein [Blastococcus xanthinilyticus]
MNGSPDAAPVAGAVRAAPTVSAVPRRMRLLLGGVGGVVLVVAVVVALALPSTPNSVVEYGVVDQVAIGGLGLVLAAGVLFLGRSRLDADASGVRVRNLVVHHQVPWTAVRAVRFERSSAWGSLLLENGDEISLHALQAVDGERAVRAVEGLRALHAAARAKDPVRPPLLYDD